MSEKPKLTRADVVMQAKRDITDLLSRNYVHENIWFSEDVGRYFVAHKCEFVVNREKRTIVALIKGTYDKRVVRRGIAKCAPDDCFNTDIGKAIALRRALGLKVPDEYLNAPQPEGVAVGDIIKTFTVCGDHLKTVKVKNIIMKRSFNSSHVEVRINGNKLFDPFCGDRVIDDTDREEYRSVAE